MTELIIIVVLLIILVVFYFKDGKFMTFDELFDLSFLRRNRVVHPTPEEVKMLITPRGVCMNRGRVNNPWTSQICKCEGFVFGVWYMGTAMCKCGDPILRHSTTPVTKNHGGGIVDLEV